MGINMLSTPKPIQITNAHLSGWEYLGDVYGNLTITGEVDPYLSPKGRKLRKISYICSCGTEGEVRLDSIRNGNTRSCGCLKVGPVNNHGKSGTKLYKVYISMLARCNNPKSQDYVHYGGRGIKVCEEWNNSFEAFDMWAIKNRYEEGLTLERMDVNKGYNPENCTWVTARQQVLNRRMLSTNTSGITGVSYNAREMRWEAQWNVEGKKKSKSFSINKYGDGAKQMAIDKRLEMEEELGITNNDP